MGDCSWKNINLALSSIRSGINIIIPLVSNAYWGMDSKKFDVYRAFYG
jgi:hypothetical protein